MISAPAYCRRFIGRKHELGFLAERFRRVESDSGAVVLVHGEAGIGKSRFIDEFHATLVPEASQFAAAQCFEYVQQPFGPFRDVVTALGSPLPFEQGDAIGSPAEQKRRLMDLIVDTLHRYARDKPLVVVFEDVHWADSGTLDTLLYLAGTVAKSHLLVIASFRSDALAETSPLASVVSRLDRLKCVWRLELGPLPFQNTVSLVEHAMEGHPRLRAATVGEIAQAAEGNPLYAEELLKSSLDAVRADSKRSELPLSLAQAVRERLAYLAPADLAILRCASAFAGPFTCRTIATVLELPENDVAAVLSEAIRRQLLIESPTSSETFSFRHAVTRQTVYDEMLALESRALHRRIATVLEASSDAGAQVAELAHHWWHSGDDAKSRLFNEAAGDRLYAMFDFSGAGLCYSRALKAGGLSAADGAALHAKCANALFLAGSTDASMTECETALTLYTKLDDASKIAATCVTFARWYFNLEDMDAAASFLNRALNALRDTPDDPLVFRAHALMALICSRRADTPGAEASLQVAERFRGVRQPQAEITLYTSRALMRALADDLPGAEHDLLRCVTIAHALGDETEVRMLGNLGLVYYWFGLRDRSLETFERSLDVAGSHNLSGYYLAFSLLQYANACLGLGDLRKVVELVNRSVSCGVYSRDVQTEAACLGLVAGLRLGDDELVARCARTDLIEPAFASGVRRHLVQVASAFAEWHLAEGRGPEARAILHRAVAACEAMRDEADEDFFPLVAASGEKADISIARSLLQRYTALVKRKDAQAQLCLFEAFAARAAGTDAERLDWAERAALAYRECERPYPLAQSLELAGRFSDALVEYRRAQSTRDAHRLEQRLYPVNRRGRSKDTLTNREREVATLVTQGKTNKAIAEDLFIGERTVEAHVAAAFAKLGVSTRAELAARIAREKPTR